MGQKLDYFKFRNSTNPFGILFHPVALEKFIGFAANAKTFTEEDIFFHNERWHCFDAHSDLSHTDKDVLLTNLNSAIADTSELLKKSSHIIITLGTAWVYRNIESNALVANCHKVPQKEFIKELLSVATIQQSLQNIISLIHTVNPTAQILFTVSPVRHIKDGFIQNQWSKANLISALQETLNAGPKLNSFYFPSYEIMMDELRDYRFYSEDMIHPNQTAIDYIWERFTEACISPETTEIMKIADSIQKGLQHRSFNPQSQQHLAFVAKLQEKIAVLQKQHPHITF
jgi:lysophospholipase L1-like esterase